MATSGSRSGRISDMQLARAFRSQQDLSPDRNKVWLQKPKPDPRVPVVYYLSRNGHLEHPHFIEVPLSSSHGLFLRDVISRLDLLRGKGMAAFYSWSCKRSYKNGFVWHDLSDDDFIYPAHGREYVLKGSLLPRQEEPAEIQVAAAVDLDYPAAAGHGHSRRRNQSCSSIDFSLEEYSVYKTEPSCRSAAADASTQTDDVRRRRRRQHPEIVEEKIEKTREKEPGRDEIEISISPPPSDSSPETLEKLMKAEGRPILRTETASEESSAAGKIQRPAVPSGKSSVLMQLITCGSISFKDCSAGHGLITQYKMRAPRGGIGGGGKGASVGGGPKLENKEYFSGSLVETKKEELPALKRSNSYNADR